MYKIFCRGGLDYQSKLDWMHMTDLTNQGWKLMASKDYEQAIAVYNQIIQEFQDYPSYIAISFYTSIKVL
jgi:hypothetical protein